MSEPKGRGAGWTEERGTSDEGRRRLKGAPEASGRHSTHRVRSGRWFLFSCTAGGELGDDVQVTQVPGVLPEQVEQDPLQRRRVGAGPAFTGFAHLVEVVGLDDGPAPRALLVQVSQQGGGRLLRRDGP